MIESFEVTETTTNSATVYIQYDDSISFKDTGSAFVVRGTYETDGVTFDGFIKVFNSHGNEVGAL